MRHIAIVLLVACGSNQPAPAEPVDPANERPADWWITKTPASSDAGVQVDGGETFASVTDPAKTVTEVLADEGAAIEPGVTEPEIAEPDEPELPDGVTMEDGIAVVRTNKRAWCGRATCWPREAYCREQNKGKACALHVAYACFKLTYRTTGARTTFCLSTYGECDKWSDLAVEMPESKDVGECVIMRYDPKYRPKK